MLEDNVRGYQGHRLKYIAREGPTYVDEYILYSNCTVRKPLFVRLTPAIVGKAHKVLYYTIHRVSRYLHIYIHVYTPRDKLHVVMHDERWVHNFNNEGFNMDPNLS